MQTLTASTSFTIRSADLSDLPALAHLVERSLRQLGIRNYATDQVEGLVKSLDGVDRRLVEDGTLHVAQIGGRLAGCAAWSRYAQLYGASASVRRLDPAHEAAKIRNVFVDPDFARRGIGRRLTLYCEAAAAQAGYRKLELLATLTGKPLYEALGYREIERVDIELPNGQRVPAVKMQKQL